MPVSASFSESVGELLAFAPELRLKRMFGGVGVFTADVMFALIIDDELFLKADDQSRPVFEAEGCTPWRYERGGESRDMSYMRAPDTVWDEPDEARRWASLAMDAAWRKRASKPKRR